MGPMLWMSWTAALVMPACAGAPVLAEGDVVFMRSASRQADAIALATGSEWTHVGVVRLRDGEPWVLEAVSPVSLTPWEAWRARAKDGRVAIRRHPQAAELWDDEAVAALDALQRSWLGRPYDVRFRWGADALYCSELVHMAYAQAAGERLGDLRTVRSYGITDPVVLDAMRKRWGRVPLDQRVIAPSDLWTAVDWVPVR